MTENLEFTVEKTDLSLVQWACTTDAYIMMYLLTAYVNYNR